MEQVIFWLQVKDEENSYGMFVRFPAPFLEFDMAEQPEVNQRIAEVLFEEWIIAFLRIGSAWAGPSLRMHNMKYLRLVSYWLVNTSQHPCGKVSCFWSSQNEVLI